MRRIILFLDDDHSRHAAFRARVEALGYSKRFTMIYVFTADEAIKTLREHEGSFVQAFLDHDLSEDDVLVKPGEVTKVPTGMTVVDHIVAMKTPPETVVVHSLNYDAAVEMSQRLAALRTIIVKRVPFSQLILQLS